MRWFGVNKCGGLWADVFLSGKEFLGIDLKWIPFGVIGFGLFELCQSMSRRSATGSISVYQKAA